MPLLEIRVEDVPQEFFTPVSQENSIGCVAKKILAQQLRIILDHQQDAVQSDDPEPLHQVRMAIRRMRTCLRVMEPMIGDDIVNRLMPGMKQSGSLLGEVRDIDSFIIWLGRIREFMHFKVRVAIDAIEKRYRSTRNQEKHIVVEELEGESYQDWMLALIGYLQSDEGPETANVSLNKAAPDILKNLLAYAQGTTKDASTASFKKLHKLRIRCKWLRYFCEFFNDAYDGRLLPVIKETKVLQSELGIVQDHTRDIKLLKKDLKQLSSINCVDDNSVSAIILFFTRHRRNTRKRFKKIWKDYTAKHNQKRFQKIFKKIPPIEETPAQNPSD